MAMDALSVAVELANAIRVFVVAYGDEPKVIISSRQLAHSCSQYEDSVADLLNLLQRTPGETDQRIQRICDQIQNDTRLMKEIVDETNSIAKSTAKHGQVINTLKTLFTGRLENIKELESQLLSRVHMISLEFIRLQAVGATREQQDHAFLLKTINDCDGVLFWDGHFGRDRAVSFQRFTEAYQAYLSQTFLFRRLKSDHLTTLLRCTLLEDHMATVSTSVLMQAEVSVTAFANWLKLFGPMKETLIKAAAVSNPSLGVSLGWFQRSADRDVATRKITQYVANLTSSGIPERMVIVRYSSKPDYHFVVSVLPPGVGSVQHLPVVNTAKGYVIAGESCAFAPTLLDCLQVNVFSKLFAAGKVGCENTVALSRQPLEEWDRIYAEVTATLPEGHYPDMAMAMAAAAMLELNGEGVGDNHCKTSSSLSGFFAGSSFTSTAATTPAAVHLSGVEKATLSEKKMDSSGVHENPTTVGGEKHNVRGPCLCM